MTIADAPRCRTGIAARNLSKVYRLADGSSAEALSDVSFQISQGEFATIAGPSGCGKSTLLKMVAGLLSKSGGELTMNDVAIVGPRPARLEAQGCRSFEGNLPSLE